MQSIKNVLPIYTQRGLQVESALLDGELVPLCTDLLALGINPNFATQNEHVPEIERQHRLIKECACACRHALPFKVLPRLMLVENREQLRTMAQHVPTKRRNQICESTNLIDGDKIGLEETLSIYFWFLRAGTQSTNPQ